MRVLNAVGALMLAGVALVPRCHAVETCTTQSQMQPAQRDELAGAARGLALGIQANDQAGLRTATIAEYQSNFAGIGGLVAGTAAKVKGTTPQVEQLYLLDGSTLQAADGPGTDASFNCSLNKSQFETSFTIPQLPAGRYAFTMVRMEGDNPWLISMLLRAEGGAWKLAGLYPKPLTAGGHDGLWYWQQARIYKAQREAWNAWLYLQEAQALTQPAPFVSSTHLEKLQTEEAADAPPALSAGLSAETPFVVRGGDGVEYRFTSVSVDDSLPNDKVDVVAHLTATSIADAAATRKRNLDAMAALVDGRPELRKAFHGVLIFAEAPGAQPYGTEEVMEEIH